MKKKQWTVIGRYAESGQIVADEAIAGTGRSAFRKAKAEREAAGEADGWEPIAAIDCGTFSINIVYGDEA